MMRRSGRYRVWGRGWADFNQTVLLNQVVAGSGSSADLVHMPNKEKFTGIEEHYSTLFHELTHSKSHEKRLNRKDNNSIAAFGDADYSKEELVAEMGAAYL